MQTDVTKPTITTYGGNHTGRTCRSDTSFKKDAETVNWSVNMNSRMQKDRDHSRERVRKRRSDMKGESHHGTRKSRSFLLISPIM